MLFRSLTVSDALLWLSQRLSHQTYHVVVHVRADEERNSRLVGFVVPKREIKRANGRNRVKRQLRHLMRERIADLPSGTRIVIRASRKALGIPSKELADHLDRVMERAWRKWDAR